MGDASMEVGGVLEVSSHSFFKMHQIPCDYEKRDPADVMPLDKVREGLRHLNVRINTFYDRPESSVPSAGGNSAFASGTGAASFLKRGQILTSVKLLKRLRQEGLDSPVFFVGYRNYEKKLLNLQQILSEECAIIEHIPEHRVKHLLEVSLGGLFLLKSYIGTAFIRIRVTKILLETSSVEYWAVDEAFFGNCNPTDMMFINQRLADLEILAVPAVFETDPKPAQLEKFERHAHPYCMARVSQPKYSNDFGPRKITLI